jgi:hypothetical protein
MKRGALRLGTTARLRVSLCAVAIVLLAPAAAQAAKPAYLKGHAYRHGAVPFRGHPRSAARRRSRPRRPTT